MTTFTRLVPAARRTGGLLVRGGAIPLALAIMTACGGGGGSSPAMPTPTPPGPSPPPTGDSAALSWTPPVSREDGSALTNLAGYRIRYGTSPGNYSVTVVIDNPGITSFVVEDLTPATYYFVVTAVDANGEESRYSNSASKTIS